MSNYRCKKVDIFLHGHRKRGGEDGKKRKNRPVPQSPAAGQGPGRNLPGLTHIDSACVEMLAAKTVCLCGTGGVPGVDWEASKRR